MKLNSTVHSLYPSSSMDARAVVILKAKTERHIEAFKLKCWRLLCISYTEHKTNEYVEQQASWQARDLVVNGETTKALLVWPHHPTQHQLKNHHARHPGERQKKEPPEEIPAGKHTGMDKAKQTDPATHSRRHTKVAMLQWHFCDRPGEGAKVKVKVWDEYLNCIVFQGFSSSVFHNLDYRMIR